MDSEVDKVRKRQLLLLKKELKCWESMFERKHGRKPTKTDIDDSPLEIRDTYCQYQKAKSKLERHGKDGVKESKVEEHDVGMTPSKRTANTAEMDGDDVFGASLNKKKASPEVGIEKSERQATWKLRKWTKGQGYKTVVINKVDARKEFDSVTPTQETDVTGSDADVVAELQTSPQLSSQDLRLDTELEALSQEVKIRNVGGAHRPPFRCVSPVIAGQYTGHSSSPRKLRRSHRVSTKWLESCTPDLSSLKMTENTSSGSGRNYSISSPSGTSEAVCEVDRDRIDDSELAPRPECGQDYDSSSESEDGPISEADLVCKYSELSKLEGIQVPVSSTSASEHEKSERMEDSVGLVQSTYSTATPARSVFSELESLSSRRSTTVPQPQKNSITSRRGDHFAGHGSSLSEELSKFLPTCHVYLGSQDSQHIDDTQLSSDIQPSASSDIQPSASSDIPSASSYIQPSASSDIQLSAESSNTQPFSLTQTTLLSQSAHQKTTACSINTQQRNYTSHSSSSVPKLRSKSSLRQDKDSGRTQPVEEQISCLDGGTQAIMSKGTRLRGAKTPSSSLSSVKEWKEKDLESVGDRLSSPDDIEDKWSDSLESRSMDEKGSKFHTRTSKSTSVSENFVRLNMKVKRYSKKPGRITGSAYKRKMWKKYQKGQEGSGGGGGGGGGAGSKGHNICFRCGKPGHWAKNCTESGGSKNLGQFAGEKVQFSDSVALQGEEEVDEATLKQLVKDSPFPSIEEAAMMARGIKLGGNQGTQSAHADKKIDDDAVFTNGDEVVTSGTDSTFVPPPPCYIPPPPPPPAVEPFFQSEDAGIIATPAAVYETMQKFGYESFRPRQEEAITRILSGISTLVVLSTGTGKSLCYQLPAYLYAQKTPCITLVVSPLVALMEDQVRHFPLSLRGACLHTNQTQSQREKVVCDVMEGRVNVLLLSPEALVGGALWGRHSLSRLPPVAFACIDEAHCVSEWSHNFRPSYLRICKVLRERLGVKCLLGLTATATRATTLSVASHLGIAEENIIRGSTLPSNLHITASCDQDREQALVHLLQSPRMQHCNSIIIYCTRQQQTERISQLLRTCLQSLSVHPQEDNSDDELCISDPKKSKETKTRKEKASSRKRKADGGGRVGWGRGKKKLRLDWSAECYHAGMPAAQRKKVQMEFMTGSLRIVVATIAFGMGLNKADVRAIIHYNMPKSFESFVQEIGRAGRDGLPAFCHVFVDKKGSDMVELRRHIYSNTVDPYPIKQLVKKAFPKCQCKEIKLSSTATPSPPQDGPQCSQSYPVSQPLLSRSRWCAGHEVSIPIEAAVQALDVKEECLSTLLCYLEFESWVEVMNSVNDTCTLKCYGGLRQLRALARKVPSVAAATAMLKQQGTDLDHANSISFSVVGLSDSMGWESHIVRSELRDLQYNDRQTGSRSGANSTVLVEFSNPAFHLRSPGDLTAEEQDSVCDSLYKRVKKQEELDIKKLHLLHSVLQSVAYDDIYNCFSGGDDGQNQVMLKSLIHQYFEGELDSEHLSQLGISPLEVASPEMSPDLRNEICRSIHALVTLHTDQKFTGRAIARIFHGIASPCFPAVVWGRQPRFWRKHLDVDFNLLCQIATRKLVELR